MRRLAAVLLGSLFFADAANAASAASRVLLDDFESVAGWSAHPSDGVNLIIGQDAGVHGKAIRFDVEFTRGAGYAVARKAFDVPLPPNYRFRFAIKGDIPTENLEFKLIDSTGANVWWLNRRDFTFPVVWDSLSTKQRQIEFAWGPIGGGELARVAAIEFAITAGSGGRGTVWLDDFTLEPLPPADAPAPPPITRVSSAVKQAPAALAVDADSLSSVAKDEVIVAKVKVAVAKDEVIVAKMKVAVAKDEVIVAKMKVMTPSGRVPPKPLVEF